MATTKQPAKVDKSGLHTSVHRFRVMRGNKIIGQFSNIALAADAAAEYRNRGSIVLDMSVNPPVVVYRDGKTVDDEGK